jgi:membrane protease YdiL (CAAX protease family)
LNPYDSPATETRPAPLRGEGLVLLVACLIPTLVTLVYFEWAQGSPSSTQQIIYAVAKVVQFSLPLVWVAWVDRRALGRPRGTCRGIPAGIGLGIAIGGAIWGLYLLLAATPLMTEATGPIGAKVSEIGISSVSRFVAVGVFYAFVHSLLEEYYWRWFVFGRLQRLMTLQSAIALSSLAFALHHVVVLWHYFSHMPLVVAAFSAGVAIGGALWAALYRWSDSLLGPWVSHLLVDAAIFSIGLHMIWPLLAGPT